VLSLPQKSNLKDHHHHHYKNKKEKKKKKVKRKFNCVPVSSSSRRD
jgi:hypothetical protein